MKRLAILSSAAALLATAAHANLDIDDVDLDGDGFASFAELRAFYPGLQRVFWDDIDTNDDNRADASELLAPEAQTVLSRYELGSASVRGVGSLDTDGDGFASMEELMAAYPGFDRPFFDDIDTNDDGRVDSNEIYAPDAQVVLSRYERNQTAPVYDLADLDVTGDGFLEFSELEAAYPGLQQVFFDDIDTNDDGRVDSAELLAPEAQTELNRYE